MSRIRSAGFEERLGQDQTSPMWSEHLARYRHPLTSRGARVLDVACGAGVGLLAMSTPPRVVVGADADRPALLDARRLVGAARLVQVDAGALPFPSGAFDLVTSFETVEHVQDDRRMVAELGRVIAPGGLVLVSTPNKLITSPDGPPANPFHVREYTSDTLDDLMRSAFSEVEIVGQATSPAYGRSVFWMPPRTGLERVQLIGLKVARRLPPAARRALDRVLPRRLFPGPDDFEFSADSIDGSHGLLAICRP